jgi:hypothetical protein
MPTVVSMLLAYKVSRKVSHRDASTKHRKGHMDHHDELRAIFSSLVVPMARWNNDLIKITDQLDSEP